MLLKLIPSIFLQSITIPLQDDYHDLQPITITIYNQLHDYHDLQPITITIYNQLQYDLKGTCNKIIGTD